MKVWKNISYILLLFLVLSLSSIKSQAAEKGIIFVGESHISIASTSVTPSQGGDNTLAGYILDDNLFFVFENSSDVGKAEWLENKALDSVRGTIDAHENIGEWSIIIQHGATESMYPERWEKYIPIWQKFKNTLPDSKIYVLSIPPLPENGRYWDEWVKANNLPAPFSGHDNKEVQAFNKFCEENSPVPYLDFYGVYDGGQALENSGSTLDSLDTIDPNHFAPEVYRSVLKKVIKEIDSGSAMVEAENNSRAEAGIKDAKMCGAIAEAENSSKVESSDKGILAYYSRLLEKFLNI